MPLHLHPHIVSPYKYLVSITTHMNSLFCSTSRTTSTASTDIRYCQSLRTQFAVAAVDTRRNNSGNFDMLQVAGPAVLPGHTVAVVCSLLVGIPWELGIPGCSCNTGYMKLQRHSAAAAVVAGCKMTACLLAAGCSFVGSAASAVGLTDCGDMTTDSDDILHCHHSLRHHTLHLIKTQAHMN